MSLQNKLTHGECLSDALLTGYLEGGLAPAVKAASEVHLVACDRCRASLAMLMRMLKHGGLPASPAEEAEIDAIVDFRRRKHPVAAGRPSLLKKLLPIAGIAASLLLGWIFWRSGGESGVPRSAEAVVQLLMDQKRIFEPRMSGQSYKPMERTRAPQGGLDFDLVRRQMEEFRAEPYYWGKFYLLKQDPGEGERAIEFLKKAADDPEASASVHNDLGVAYLMFGGDAGLSLAGKEFQDALKKDRDFEPAVFNLALFYERSREPQRAETEWRRYLQLDPQSGWADEARAKLKASR
ncbi:MAG TPA: hypothetical protein VFY29_15270 [Terriglobia bacterium]|nr:hypothetical protein [Terriglobia bacterium]